MSAKPTRPRILVLEDEPIVALDLVGELEQNGFAIVGPAMSVEEGIRLVETVGCDAAILDVKLGETDSTPVVERLVAGGIPILVITGYADSEGIFEGLPKLVKPINHSLLLSELRKLLARP